MWALALVFGPLAATVIASNLTDGGGIEGGVIGGENAWRRTYFITIALGVVNLLGVMVGFRDTLWQAKWRQVEQQPRADERGESRQQQQEKETTASGLRDMVDILKVKDVWLIGLFFFFALGASMTSSGASHTLSLPYPTRLFTHSVPLRLGRRIPLPHPPRRPLKSGLRSHGLLRRYLPRPPPPRRAHLSLRRETNAARLFYCGDSPAVDLLVGSEYYGGCDGVERAGLLFGSVFRDGELVGMCTGCD